LALGAEGCPFDDWSVRFFKENYHNYP
jgi:hypothetical protein